MDGTDDFCRSTESVPANALGAIQRASFMDDEGLVRRLEEEKREKRKQATKKKTEMVTGHLVPRQPRAHKWEGEED